MTSTADDHGALSGQLPHRARGEPLLVERCRRRPPASNARATAPSTTDRRRPAATPRPRRRRSRRRRSDPDARRRAPAAAQRGSCGRDQPQVGAVLGRRARPRRRSHADVRGDLCVRLRSDPVDLLQLLHRGRTGRARSARRGSARAVTGPTPGNVSSWATVAVFRSTVPPVDRVRRGPTHRAARAADARPSPPMRSRARRAVPDLAEPGWRAVPITTC